MCICSTSIKNVILKTLKESILNIFSYPYLELFLFIASDILLLAFKKTSFHLKLLCAQNAISSYKELKQWCERGKNETLYL